MTTEKTQFTKVRKTATTRDNARRTLIKKRKKTIIKKTELNKIPDLSTAVEGDEGCI